MVDALGGSGQSGLGSAGLIHLGHRGWDHRGLSHAVGPNPMSPERSSQDGVHRGGGSLPPSHTLPPPPFLDLEGWLGAEVHPVLP